VADDPGQLPSPIPSAARKFHNTPNWFESTYSKTYHKASDLRYYAKQLHFHTDSEHKINGELKEFEMHIVHQSNINPTGTPGAAKYPFGYLAVIGILFDPVNYDKDKVSDE
jgi:hypothetical protein